MSQKLDVYMLPRLLDPRALSGSVAVMIDVLRASTTISHALAAGAQAILPCEDVSQARNLAENLPTGTVLLGGERGGQQISGFDLGNSPSDYTRDSVGGKTVVFTTTNGTRALIQSQQANRVLIGAFVNLNALVRMLAKTNRPVHLVCAGTDGKITSEDVLCAGAIAVGYEAATGSFESTDDQAQMAMTYFRSQASNQISFLTAMGGSLGGRNLQQLGFQADIDVAATWDVFDFVPEYFSQQGQITAEFPAKREAPEKQWVSPPGSHINNT